MQEAVSNLRVYRTQADPVHPGGCSRGSGRKHRGGRGNSPETRRSHSHHQPEPQQRIHRDE